MRTWKRPRPARFCWPGVLLKMGTYGMLRFNLGLFPEQSRAQRMVDHGPGADRHHLWRAGGDGAAEYEKADRILLDQPSGLRRAGNFQLHASSALTAQLSSCWRTGFPPARCSCWREFFSSAATLTKSPNSAVSPLPCRCMRHFSLFIVLASVGLPLLNGFIGEFLVLSGAFSDRAVYGILGATGVIWSACYLLWMYQRVFFGKVTHDGNVSLPDLSGREHAALWPTAACGPGDGRRAADLAQCDRSCRTISPWRRSRRPPAR